MKIRILLSITLLLITASARAQLEYVEAINGDLSGDNSAPTPLVFSPGANTIAGTMGRDEPTDPLDRDIFTFTLAPGLQLTSIQVLQFEPTNASFYAIASGTSISLTDPVQHLSNMLVQGTGEIMDDLSAGSHAGGNKLNGSLGPGTYTIWFQELASVVTYRFAYTVTATTATATPEPAAFGLLALGILPAFRAWKRRN